MSPTTPEICSDRLRTCPAWKHAPRKRAVSRAFQWMAGKTQQCMQAMSKWMQAPASPGPSHAVTCTQVAFAPISPSLRGLRYSKGDFDFKQRR